MEHVFKLFEFNVYNNKGVDKDSDEEYICKENKDKSTFAIQMFGINEEGQKSLNYCRRIPTVLLPQGKQ